MKFEHCTSPCAEFQFETSNYQLSTTPSREWNLVVNGCEPEPKEMHHGRKLQRIEELMQSEEVRRGKLERHEVIAVVLYTGPMFQVYNTLLRRFPAEEYKKLKERQSQPFATTIHVLVSAVQKLSRTTVLASGSRWLYRGLGGNVTLPASFFFRDAQGCRGITEWGFMSTTSEKTVALCYSGLREKRPFPIVLRIRPGAVDRGASVRSFSQYPLELEYLYLPCSFLEPEGRPFVEVTVDGIVTVYPVRVNANLKTCTVEELLHRKRRTHIAAFCFLVDEMAEHLSKLIEKEIQCSSNLKLLASSSGSLVRPSSSSLSMILKDVKDRDGHSAEEFIKRIVEQCSIVYRTHEAASIESYTEDRSYYRLVLNMIQVKSMALSKFKEWLVHLDSHADPRRFSASLRHGHRSYVSWLERRMERGLEANLDPALALELCKAKDLVIFAVDEVNDDGETPLITASADGRQAKDVQLLAYAQADVRAVRSSDGASALLLAAQFGHIETVRVLAKCGGDVCQANASGLCPLSAACQTGNLDCVRVLLELKADLNKADMYGDRPLHQAARYNYTDIVKELINRKADINALNKDGKLAFDDIVHNDMTAECRKLLHSEQSGLMLCSHLDVEKQKQRPLIIATAGTSEVDLYFALAEYLKADADILFIINFPAYLTVKANVDSYETTCPGLGFQYMTERAAAGVQAKDPPAAYKAFLERYDEKEVCKAALADMTFEIVRRVLMDQTPEREGQVYFCVGGYNSVNPFSHEALADKNEILAYCELVQPHTLRLNSMEEGATYDVRTGDSASISLHHYDHIYLDFNGSMAHFNRSWLERLEHPRVVHRIRGAFVTGGVRAEERTVTTPAIPGTLNRFSSATMNQLYHPRHAASFFMFVRERKIPCFVVTNNEVGIVKNGASPEADLASFLDSNGLAGFGGFLRNLAAASCRRTGRPLKPFNLYTAVALRSMLRDGPEGLGAVDDKKSLFYSSEYGISLVASQHAAWEDARASYRRQACPPAAGSPTDGPADPSTPEEQRKELLLKELAIMDSLQYMPSLPVRDLKFHELQASTNFKVQLM